MAKSVDRYPGLLSIKDAPTALVFRALMDQLGTVRDNAQGPILGTLKPDTKPKLSPQDLGRLFYAQDFDRTYKWNGHSWEDAPAQPTRRSISFFSPNQNPGIGWTPCNGSPVNLSTSEGRTITFTPTVTPDFNGLKAWIRL